MRGYRVYDGKTRTIKADISAKHGRELFARFDGDWITTGWPSTRAYRLHEGATLELLGARIYFFTGDLIAEAS